MTRSVVSTQQAPAAIGPYSQAIVHGGFVFTAAAGEGERQGNQQADSQETGAIHGTSSLGAAG